MTLRGDHCGPLTLEGALELVFAEKQLALSLPQVSFPSSTQHVHHGPPCLVRSPYRRRSPEARARRPEPSSIRLCIPHNPLSAWAGAGEPQGGGTQALLTEF